MKYLKHITIGLFLCLFFLVSCEPRIDFDEGQWGDNAIITAVLVFTVQEGDHQLQEYYENGELTTGIRRIFVGGTSIVIDEDASTAVLSVPAATDLTNVGLVIRHKAKKIEPVSGSPIPGFVDDFSSGSFIYKVISADGTERNWTISIVKK